MGLETSAENGILQYNMVKHSTTLIPALAAVLLAGCVHVKSEPVEINLNISGELRLKVDRELDDVFAALDAESETLIAPTPNN